MEQMVSEIFTDSRDLHGLFEESAFQKEQKKCQFTGDMENVIHMLFEHLKSV